ncbi:MAG: acyl carrier protein [Clostridia bacterium]|nr:acyl carrier protein [Oscillospiraceae bacterium]MBQ2828437.1 acyl carrier protein [Clostridia bacterium]
MQELIALIENYVEVDEIKAEDNFKFNLGMSSFDTMCLINDIKTELGVEVTPADFIRLKTVGAVADYINSIK